VNSSFRWIFVLVWDTQFVEF